MRKKQRFQWAPTLEGECYTAFYYAVGRVVVFVSMGTHP